LLTALILASGFAHAIEADFGWSPAEHYAVFIKVIAAIVSWVALGSIVYLMQRTSTRAEIVKLRQEINERDSLLHNIISVTPYAIFWKDTDCNLMGGNEACAELLGLESTELIAQVDDKDFGFSQEDIDRYKEDDRRVMRLESDPVPYEEIVTFPDGPRILRTTKMPMKDTDGNVTGLVGLTEDVTENRLVEQSLLRADMMFAALQKADIVGIVTCKYDGKVVQANDEALRIMRSDRAQLDRGEVDWRKLTPSEWTEPDSESIEELLRNGIVKPFEKEFVGPDGTRTPVLLGMTLLPDESKEWLCFIVDITEQKRIERELHAAKQQAEAGSRAKSEFLANMSHEIRTPLNGILGFTEVLRRNNASPQDAQSHLETIHNSGQHLLGLINDILDLSKIEAGKMEFQYHPCSPRQIIEEVKSVLSAFAAEKQLDLKIRWAGEMPSRVITDAGRLRQLLTNLIGNAIKFTESGGVSISAEWIPDITDSRLEIKVRDTGIGIRPENIEKIFSPFDQADNSITRQFGGTGLGLAISRHIAEGLGGELSVTSELKVGSEFTVNIPAWSHEAMPSIDAANEEPDAGSDAIDKVHGSALPGTRVLLCEDGETNRDLFGLLLSEAGAIVTFAENGQEGLDCVEQAEEEFDVILMDMQMPVLDGYSAARQLRRAGWVKPIIALTAHAMRGDEEKCRDAGCSGYLTKPIKIDQLLEVVSNALNQCDESPRLAPEVLEIK
tara:strand:+ start:102050 stop:104230 length:2181 start_codon:yes stop_codon:yes gene_type:complete